LADKETGRQGGGRLRAGEERFDMMFSVVSYLVAGMVRVRAIVDWLEGNEPMILEF
jgi:hypothetical protein